MVLALAYLLFFCKDSAKRSGSDGQTKLGALRFSRCKAKEHDFVHQPKRLDDGPPAIYDSDPSEAQILLLLAIFEQLLCLQR